MTELKVDEMRSLTGGELVKQLDEAHRELFSLRFRLATKQLDNYREIPKVKKKIARLNTMLRERELSGAVGMSVPTDQSKAEAEG